MRSLTITSGYQEWRSKAREVLAAKIPPEEILWTDQDEASLFSEEPIPPPLAENPPNVPKDFPGLAHTIGHHRSPERWAFLYRFLWRLTWGGEVRLLKMATDPDTSRLMGMRKEIGRDIHKMHAFVRFKKIGEDDETKREQFVAWYEPDHQIMPLTASFFRKRFSGMDWTIFTPTGSANWDGENLKLGPGIDRMDVPEEELDDLWRGYYRSIFNPARIKVKAMQAEMPRKFWKNLPEAELISDLIAKGNHRVDEMLEEKPRALRKLRNNAYLENLQELSARRSDVVLEPDSHAGKELEELRELSSDCAACPLHHSATGTVFGEGPDDAEIMIVGEQPGDQEDLLGRPFVGPAGQLLDQALEQAGLDRKKIYLTNAVKHFKFVQQGNRRLHQNPNVDEISRCKPWLIAELLKVKPTFLICLGATASKSMIDPHFKVTRQRGIIPGTGLAETVITTVHPSFLLRLPDTRQRAEEFEKFVADLSNAAS